MSSDFRFNSNALLLHGFSCHQFETLGSTQDLLKEWVSRDLASPGTVIVASGQTNGRGRQGHSWESLHGKGLWMSVYFRPFIPAEMAFSWNMQLALAVCRALDALVPWVPWKIKWPNDWVTPQGLKVGGMLVENQLRGSMITDSLVGIGINVEEGAVDNRLPSATTLRGEWKRARHTDLSELESRMNTDSLWKSMLPELKILLDQTTPKPEKPESEIKIIENKAWNPRDAVKQAETRLYGLGRVLPFESENRIEYWIPTGLDQGGGLHVLSEQGGLQQTLIHPNHRLSYALNLL